MTLSPSYLVVWAISRVLGPELGRCSKISRSLDLTRVSVEWVPNAFIFVTINNAACFKNVIFRS